MNPQVHIIMEYCRSELVAVCGVHLDKPTAEKRKEYLQEMHGPSTRFVVVTHEVI